MATLQRVDWGAIVKQALAAGIVGGIVVMAFLWLTQILPAHGTLQAFLQWIASAAIGKVAFTAGAYALLGLLVHFIVSIGWAGGFAFLAHTRPFMNQRWIVSGLVYGLVVYFFMELLLLGAGALKPPATPNDFVNALVANSVFFGLPVAYVVSRMNRA